MGMVAPKRRSTGASVAEGVDGRPTRAVTGASASEWMEARPGGGARIFNDEMLVSPGGGAKADWTTGPYRLTLGRRPTPGSSAVAVPAFTLPDQGGRLWSLADHLDAGVVIVTLRGDW